MEKYSYHFENYSVLTQFVAAFDDCFVYRYTKDRVAKEKINVRYVMGPKHRVMYDIVNQAKNITLPVVAMEQKNIRRDSSRIQNKDFRMYRHHLNSKDISKIPQPVPVLIDVDVSIVANYKEDIDQIISNFIPWCNPYFIISWKIPEGFDLDFDDEIRTEVSWSGDVNFESPVDISAQDKYKIVGNTSFTIKGWIFPPLENISAPIYVVRNNFHPVATGDDLYTYDAYSTLSGVDYTGTDVVLISAYPEFTNMFYGNYPLFGITRIPNFIDTVVTFFGKRFSYNNTWYLSSNETIPALVYEEIDTAKFPTISAYRIPDEDVVIVSDNVATLQLSSVWLSGFNQFTFVTANSAGWADLGFILILDNSTINMYIQPNSVYTYLQPSGLYTYLLP